MHILLRVPHTSHRTQGEDVSSFARFKPELRRQKTKMLTRNVQQHGFYGLRSTDFMKVVTPAWNHAFSKVHNLSGWADTGISPFTRKVYFDLRESEACASTVCSSSMIDYTPLQSLTGTHVTNDADSSEEEGGEGDAAVRTGRLSSAQIYSIGPVTADEAYGIVKEKVESKRKMAEDAKARKEARASKLDERLQELRAAVMSYPTHLTVSAIHSLTMPRLQGLLLRDAGHRWDSEFSKLKSKSQLVEAVCALYPPKTVVQPPNSAPVSNTPPSPTY